MERGVIRFTVPGDPLGKDRPRIVKIGQFSRMANTKKTVDYESRIAFAATEAMRGRPPIEGPLTLTITARFAPAPSASKKARVSMLLGETPPTKRPDIDNIGKIVSDALNGVAYHDDAAIVQMTLSKVYAEIAGVDVVVAPYIPPHPRNWSLSQEVVL